MTLRTRSWRERAERAAAHKPLSDAKAALSALRNPPTVAAATAPTTAPPPPAAPTPPAEARRVTTRRTAHAVEKRGPVESPSLLAWARAQPCEFPPGRHACHGPSDPHHWPTTGSHGGRIDALVTSACRAAHDMAHAGAWTGEEQGAAVHRTWTRFWRMADRATKVATLRELLAGLDA